MGGARRFSLALPIVSALLVAGACTTFNGLVADTPSGQEGGVEAGAADAGSDSPIGDSGGAGDDGTPPDAAGYDDAGCPTGRGPAMVNVGTTCVDSTEVTVGQYKTFLDNTTVNEDIKRTPGGCSWKASFTPNGWPRDAGEGRYPIIQVDWCDAYAYCTWAGKHLCGLVGGGAATNHERNDAAADEWFNACSGGGQMPYPYGATYQPQACNGSDRNMDSGLTVPVGSIATCVGGYPGLFDMSGNADEWVDYCVDDAGAQDLCRTRGGAADDTTTSIDCPTTNDGGDLDKRNYRSAHKGFRCCATPR